MFAKPEDLLSLAGAGGRLFEEFVLDLTRAEAYRHGIPPHQVHWDHRTNVGDRGRDLVVAASHTDDAPRFVPQKPSIWSIKSGKDGIDPNTLRNELVSENREEIKKHLQNGNTYVWCMLQPIDEDGRNALQEKVKKIVENDYAFDPKLVEFRTITDLCTVLNDHPGLIAKHRQDLAHKLEGVINFEEWEREDRFAVGWVDFGGRKALIDDVQQHLRAREGINVLHIAGLSGIGKTRMLRHACDTEDLNSILYVPRFDELTPRFLRHLTRSEHLIARVVIDETPLSELENFKAKVSHLAGRLRFVTIGPARTGERSRSASNIHVLAEPDTKDGVLAVVRNAGQGLSEPVLDSIARFAAHDLRLALMLVRATKMDGAFRNLPIEDGDDVWKRVTHLFQESLGDVESFKANYPYLTLCIDLGRSGEHRAELEHLAAEFEVPIPRLDETIAAASKCGLGIQTEFFFEAAPRALAVHLFRERIWPSLQPRAQEFLEHLPDRLLRRFLERCQESDGKERLQMEAMLESFFSAALGERDITHLADRGRSRTFKAWAELDPETGLAWLRDAVDTATDEQLAQLDGESDGSGGWRGRRQVVWLCEELACFGQYFWDCEKVLFRLAQVETEPSIGNNSKAVWQSLYLPVLAHTEIPFADRAKCLLDRLSSSAANTLPLVLSAAFEALSPVGTRIAPPVVVGGRLVPEPWRPKTRDELHYLQSDFARRVLVTIEKLEFSLYLESIELILPQLEWFLAFTTITEVKQSLGKAMTDDDIKRNVRLKLDEIITEGLRFGNQMRPDDGAAKNSILIWFQELAPNDLVTRIKELTACEYWDVMYRQREKEKVDP